jgi:2-polyprenyl-3-methyl-5-hydroxy-6-metoxy-1,4-benzoquinol methylase
MIDLSQRSYEKELMDRDDIPFSDMAITLKELKMVNQRLGGHAITLKAVNKLAKDEPELLICEIGCGGGDNLAAIHDKVSTRGKNIRFIGIDMNPECIAYAKQQYPDLPCEWICSDYAAIEFSELKPSIIFSSLFCHHFTDQQLLFMLQWLKRNSTSGFFINDLHRHWLAFHLIKYITRFFSRSYLVRHDASLSVARGFKKREWENLLRKAGIAHFSIDWQWAFRWLVLVNHKN